MFLKFKIPERTERWQLNNNRNTKDKDDTLFLNDFLINIVENGQSFFLETNRYIEYQFKIIFFIGTLHFYDEKLSKRIVVESLIEH